MVEFRLLGPLEAVVDGALVALGPPQQRALLALLLLNANEVISRDRIVDELWGDQPPATSRKLIQAYVSALRKLLGRDLVLTRSPGYLLPVEADALDLGRFERLAAAGRAALAERNPALAAARLREGLDLWRGPPLAEFGFAPFAQAEIGRLEELRLGAVCDRIDADLALGRDDAIADLEALVAEQPLRERLRGQLMLALYRAGRQADALAAYRDGRRALVDELGIEPGRELRDLEQAILRQDPSLDRSVPVEPRPEPAPTGFVGRERELASLVEALDDAVAENGRVVLVGGEPGIGKSRLAEELGRIARRRGARVCVGRCWEAGGAPAYWPWVQALRAYVRDSDPAEVRRQLEDTGAVLATILPELRRLAHDPAAAAPADAEGGRFRLLEAVAGFLRSAAGARPLVVVLDDLHAADEPSLVLLRFIAGQLGPARVLVVGCYRDTELGTELAATLADVAHEPAIVRLALGGLSGPATSRLLELTMGDAPAGDVAAEVHAETGGNPLFASEIGRLLAVEGPWTERRLPIPDGVIEAIGRRLQRQSERCREVLALASVVGREFDPYLIGRVGKLDESDLFAALDEAAAARLVGAVPEAGGRLRFSHILMRDALYQDLPAPRRLRLHRAVAEALEAAYADNPEPHLTELARHYREGGAPVAHKAIEYAQRAGDRAASQYGYEEAASYYERALDMLRTATGSGHADRTCELLLSLGEVQSRAGNGAEARQALQRAAELAQKTGRPDQLARAALEYEGRFGWARASIDPFFVPLLEHALAAVGTADSAARVRLLARLAAARRDDAQREPRRRLAREAREIAERLGNPTTLAIAIESGWLATEGPDEYAAGAGIAAAKRLIALGQKVGDRERVFQGHDMWFNSAWTLGDRVGLEVELDALETLAAELRQPAQRWEIGTHRSMLALMEGRFADAERLVDETFALGRRAVTWAVVTHRIAQFVLRREQCRLAEIEATVRRSTHEYPALLRFQCARVHLEAELGRKREARAMLDDLLARNLAREHLDSEWLFAMTLLADPGAAVGGERAAAELYALLLPYARLYALAPSEGVFGAIARGLGVLATALKRYDEAEAHLEAAIDLERRMDARPWLAHAQHDLAAMLVARGATGDRKRAQGHLDEARATYRVLGMDAWAARAAALG